MKIPAMLTLANREFCDVSKPLYERKTCLRHHTSLKAYETTCVRQRKLAYKRKTPAMLAPMLKTMLNPDFSFHLC